MASALCWAFSQGVWGLERVKVPRLGGLAQSPDPRTLRQARQDCELGLPGLRLGASTPLSPRPPDHNGFRVCSPRPPPPPAQGAPPARAGA